MIIITGGAGFIGSCLLAELNRRGEENILLVDKLGTGEKWRNLVGKSFIDCIPKGDFREMVSTGSSVLNGVTAVFHLGACSSTTEKDAGYLLDNNYRYSKEVCQWALARGARFIYASSGATYGDGKGGYDDSDEHTPLNRPLNMYGYSKQLFDEWVLRNDLQSKIVGLKFFNVYGPNEYHKGEMASVVFKQFPAARDSKSITLFRSYAEGYADGEQKRDFIYVKDCVKVMLFFHEHRDQGGIFNLGTGKARSWNDLARAIFSALNKAPKIEYIPMPEELMGKYQYFTEAKMEKLKSAGYRESFMTLEEGVKDYVTNYLAPGRYL